MFLRPDGSVREHRRISRTEGGLDVAWTDWSGFGFGTAWIPDPVAPHGGRLVVGTQGLLGGVTQHTWLLELDANAQVVSHESRAAGRTSAFAPLGDLDGNGVPDIAAGVSQFVVCISLFCSVPANWAAVLWGRAPDDHPPNLLENPVNLRSLAVLDDLDGDGVQELLAGNPTDVGGGIQAGALWVQRLDDHGALQSAQKIGPDAGGFLGDLRNLDRFGSSVADLGDIDADGVRDIAVGAAGDNGAGPDRGAVWVLRLNADAGVKSSVEISSAIPGLAAALNDFDNLGHALTAIDLDGDGRRELIVGAPFTDRFGKQDVGGLHVFFLHADGSLASRTRIGANQGGFGGGLDAGDLFGFSLATIGDLDGDGRDEIAVGAARDDDAGDNRGAARDDLLSANRGAVWVLSLDAEGQVERRQKISDTAGRFTGELSDQMRFGYALAAAGDIDHDGTPDLLVSAGWLRSVWLLLLEPNGAVREQRLVDADSHPFHGNGNFLDGFGRALAVLDAGPSGHIPWFAAADVFTWQLCFGPGQWQDLGQGLAGTGGLIPQLEARGFTLPGEPVTFSVERARRGSSAALVFGLSKLGAPFAGGTLVPAPDVLHLGLPIDGDGRLELSLRWPPGAVLPPGASIWAQSFVVDGAAPAGLALSNAIVGRSP